MYMRVLWFAVTPSLYASSDSAYNGGGWIAALENIVRKHAGIQLGVAFEYSHVPPVFKVEQSGVVYYPMTLKRNFIEKLKDHYTCKDRDRQLLVSCMNVIHDFKPDLIHIWGSEWCFGLLYQYTDIPIVIHMQGCWPPYRNASYPPGYSFTDMLWQNKWHPKRLLSSLLQEKLSRERAEREEHILSHTANFMGRTRWDYALTTLYAPQSRYFYCPEALRPEITSHASQWQRKKRSSFTLVTVGGGQTLKGIDVILRTAYLLKKWGNLDFEWKLVGPAPADIGRYERLTDIKAAVVNVVPMGKKNAAEVMKQLLDADLYVHTAYIDNSPNAVCEAQYLGLPVISTNVGGIRSLFPDDYPQHLLIPANDPYYLASVLKQTLENDDLLEELAGKNKKIAQKRHSEKEIMSHLLAAYTNML